MRDLTVSRPHRIDIDVYRGLAALVVVAMHAREVTWVGFRQWKALGLPVSLETVLAYLLAPLVWGSIGVPIFFVLSGYCIHRSQAAGSRRPGRTAFSAQNFLVRRFFRIVPVLAGALLLTYLCDWGSGHYVPTSEKLGDTGLVSLLVNLVCLQGIAGSYYGSNGPLWTLSVEVHFYLVYPLLLAVMHRAGRWKTLGLVTAVNVVSWVVLRLSDHTVFTTYYVSWYLGVLVAEMEGSPLAEKFAQERHWLGYCGSAVVGAAGCGVFFVSSYAAFQLWAIASAIFLLTSLHRPTLFAGKAAELFRQLGLFSFSIYIVHLPVVVLLNSILFHSLKQVSLLPFVGVLVAAIGVAFAFSLLFERPALALSQRMRH